MTLEGLLAFFGILIAILAIAGPVKRRSIRLFVPWRLLGLTILLSVVMIVCHDAPLGIKPPFGWPLEAVMFLLNLGAFLLPAFGVLWCAYCWDRAKLTTKGMGRLVEVFEAALRERHFDEVERIVRRNQQRTTNPSASNGTHVADLRLPDWPPWAASALFSPLLVTAMIESQSMIHLELLADPRLLKTLDDRFAVVDTVVRNLLHSDMSPLRAAVIERYGGSEGIRCSEADRQLLRRTFLCPDWYVEANAHYPLCMAAIENLRTGSFDAEYNDSVRSYEANQGLSSRSHCPVYLALKSEVLAISEAIEAGHDADLYATDLWDIYHAVLERSIYDRARWESSQTNRNHPTPYAYLLNEINQDLRCLSLQGIEVAERREVTRHLEQLARAWSFCTWAIAISENNVSDEFRDKTISCHLEFVLQLGWQTSALKFQLRDKEGTLDRFRDLFWGELRQRFAGDDSARCRLRRVAGALEFGTRVVLDGRDWLERELLR